MDGMMALSPHYLHSVSAGNRLQYAPGQRMRMTGAVVLVASSAVRLSNAFSILFFLEPTIGSTVFLIPIGLQCHGGSTTQRSITARYSADSS